MTANFYKSSRQRLFEKLNEGSMVFLYSGIAPIKSNDDNMYPFPVNRNFYYLTGIDEPNVWLTLCKQTEGCTIFRHERWANLRHLRYTT